MDFVEQIENKEAEVLDWWFKAFADKWLESIKPHLKESSNARRLSSISQLAPHFKGLKLREITQERLEVWAL